MFTPTFAAGRTIGWCTHVLEQAAVVISPGGAYGPNGEGFFRISLTAPADRLLRKWVAERRILRKPQTESRIGGPIRDRELVIRLRHLDRLHGGFEIGAPSERCGE